MALIYSNQDFFQDFTQRYHGLVVMGGKELSCEAQSACAREARCPDTVVISWNYIGTFFTLPSYVSSLI